MRATAQVHSTLHLRSGRHNWVANATTANQLQLMMLETAQTSDNRVAGSQSLQWQHSKKHSWDTAAEGHSKLAVKEMQPVAGSQSLQHLRTLQCVDHVKQTMVGGNCYNSKLNFPKWLGGGRLHNGQVLDYRINVNGIIAQGNDRLVAKQQTQ